MAEKPTFEQFMKRVNKLLSPYLGGLSTNDMVDACWYDLYEELDGGADDSDEGLLEYAADTLADADDEFAAMREELGL